jgi:hypothetical protein
MGNVFEVTATPADLRQVFDIPGVTLTTKGQIKAYDEATAEVKRFHERTSALSSSEIRKLHKKILADLSENPDQEEKARKELDELDRAAEVRRALKEARRRFDHSTCLPLAVEMLEGALKHVRPAADIFIEDERQRYAAFGLGDIDSNLARGVEETVRRQERRLEDLKRRAENGRGSGNSLSAVAPLVEFARG